MLFYRDGVSESQYKSVRELELLQFYDAYDSAHEYLRNDGSAPSSKLTFIVVGKRHDTRFFTHQTCEDDTFLSDLSQKAMANYEILEQEEGQNSWRSLVNGLGDHAVTINGHE